MVKHRGEPGKSANGAHAAQVGANCQWWPLRKRWRVWRRKTSRPSRHRVGEVGVYAEKRHRPRSRLRGGSSHHAIPSPTPVPPEASPVSAPGHIMVGSREQRSGEGACAVHYRPARLIPREIGLCPTPCPLGAREQGGSLEVRGPTHPGSGTRGERAGSRRNRPGSVTPPRMPPAGHRDAAESFPTAFVLITCPPTKEALDQYEGRVHIPKPSYERARSAHRSRSGHKEQAQGEAPTSAACVTTAVSARISCAVAVALAWPSIAARREQHARSPGSSARERVLPDGRPTPKVSTSIDVLVGHDFKQTAKSSP